MPILTPVDLLTIFCMLFFNSMSGAAPLDLAPIQEGASGVRPTANLSPDLEAIEQSEPDLVEPPPGSAQAKKAKELGLPLEVERKHGDGLQIIADNQLGLRNLSILKESVVDGNDVSSPTLAGHEMGHALFDVGDEGHD